MQRSNGLPHAHCINRRVTPFRGWVTQKTRVVIDSQYGVHRTRAVISHKSEVNCRVQVGKVRRGKGFWYHHTSHQSHQTASKDSKITLTLFRIPHPRPPFGEMEIIFTPYSTKDLTQYSYSQRLLRYLQLDNTASVSQPGSESGLCGRRPGIEVPCGWKDHDRYVMGPHLGTRGGTRGYHLSAGLDALKSAVGTRRTRCPLCFVVLIHL